VVALPLDSDYLSDNLIEMETTLTAFQRQFSKARQAADRGDTVEIKADNNSQYVFARRPKALANPFADMEHLFGVVSLNAGKEPARDRIRRRLRKNAAA
jgi:hypothetical protein